MKHMYFSIKNNTTTTTPSYDNTDYSTILDNIIASNIKKSNTYLNNLSSYESITKSLNEMDTNKKSTNILCGCLLKSDAFTKASNFLANYGKKKNAKLPFIFGKIYKLTDGTPIIFYDDEIQIGFDLYSYSSFGDTLFLKSLTPATKKTIINIYTAGSTNINISIN